MLGRLATLRLSSWGSARHLPPRLCGPPFLPAASEVPTWFTLSPTWLFSVFKDVYRGRVPGRALGLRCAWFVLPEGSGCRGPLALIGHRAASVEKCRLKSFAQFLIGLFIFCCRDVRVLSILWTLDPHQTYDACALPPSFTIVCFHA